MCQTTNLTNPASLTLYRTIVRSINQKLPKQTQNYYWTFTREHFEGHKHESDQEHIDFLVEKGYDSLKGQKAKIKKMSNYTAKKTPPIPPPRNTPPPPVPSQTYPVNQVLYNPYGQPLASSLPPSPQLQRNEQPYQPQPSYQYQVDQYGQQPPNNQSSPQLQGAAAQYSQSQTPPYQPQYQIQTSQYNQPPPPPPQQLNNQTPQLQKAGQYGQPTPYQPQSPQYQFQTSQYNQPPPQQLNNQTPQLQKAGQYGQPQSPQSQQPNNNPQLQKAGEYNQPPQPQLQKAGEYNQPPQVGQYNQQPPQAGQYNQQPPFQPQYPQMSYPLPPSQQTIFLAPQLQTGGALASINMMAPPATVLLNKFIPPAGATFYTNGSGKSKLQVRIISGQNLIVADANGSSDPYVKIKSASIESFQATKVIEKNLNPVWSETLFLEIADVEKEILMFDVYDRDAVGCDDLLGCVGVDLSKLPLGLEVVTVENLHYAKHGTIQIGLTAIDFGLTNISPNYHLEYYNWRLGLTGMNKKDFKQIKKGSKHIDEGPYIGKITHPDYKFVCGYVKRKKTKREVAGEVGKGALKVVGYTLLLPVIALANS